MKFTELQTIEPYIRQRITVTVSQTQAGQFSVKDEDKRYPATESVQAALRKQIENQSPIVFPRLLVFAFSVYQNDQYRHFISIYLRKGSGLSSAVLSYRLIQVIEITEINVLGPVTYGEKKSIIVIEDDYGVTKTLVLDTGAGYRFCYEDYQSVIFESSIASEPEAIEPKSSESETPELETTIVEPIESASSKTTPSTNETSPTSIQETPGDQHNKLINKLAVSFTDMPVERLELLKANLDRIVILKRAERAITRARAQNKSGYTPLAQQTDLLYALINNKEPSIEMIDKTTQVIEALLN